MSNNEYKKLIKELYGHGGSFYSGKDLGSFQKGSLGTRGADSNFSRRMQQHVPVDYYDIDIDEEDDDFGLSIVIDNDILYENFLKNLYTSIADSDVAKNIKSTAGSAVKKVTSNIGIPGLMKRGKNVFLSSLFGIPLLGDAIAFFFFVKNIGDVRKASRKLTHHLNSMTNLDLGDDFLEPENITSSDLMMQFISQGKTSQSYESLLDSRLDLVKSELTDPDRVKALGITYEDIIKLEDHYDDILDNIRAVFSAFFGAVDIFFGQLGMPVSIAISIIEPEDWINELVYYHGKMIDKMAKSTTATAAVFAILQYVSKPGDLAGNLDLLFNVEKLRRLIAINDILKHYEKIETMEDKINLGLTLTDYDHGFKKFSKAMADKGLDQDSDIASKIADDSWWTKANRFFRQNILEENKQAIIDTLDYLENEEDELVDEISLSPSVSGVTGKFGLYDPDGSKTSKKRHKKRVKDANIYAENIRDSEKWSTITSGRIKFK